MEIVGWRKGRSSGRARPLTFDHVLDGLRLEGNLLSHLDGLALRGHEGDEFVAHGARVFCVSRTKEETSGGTTRALATVRLVDVEFPRHLTSSNISCTVVFNLAGFVDPSNVSVILLHR